MEDTPEITTKSFAESPETSPEMTPQKDQYIQTEMLDEKGLLHEITYLREKMEIQRNKNETIELTVRKQIDAFMKFMQVEKERE